MKHLIVVAHPLEASLTMSLARTYADELERLGHTQKTYDLYRMRFDPALPAGELAAADAAADPRIGEMQRDIAEADAVAVIYPLWWLSMPAMMKGFVDRVFARGFAYESENGTFNGLLKGKKAILITLSGAPFSALTATGDWSAVQALQDVHIFRAAGFDVLEHVHIDRVVPALPESAVQPHLARVRNCVQRHFGQASLNTAPVWFITGCSSGFGRAFAQAAVAHGFRVVATARDVAALDELVHGRAEQVLPLQLDVTNVAQIRAAVAEAERRFGGIDVLVNNAGYGYMAAVEEGEEEQIRALFETNFFGLAALTRAVLPGMRTRRRGTIVNIASVAGIIGFAGSGYYAATKFAVEGLTESLAAEVEPLGIRVMLVEPGPFRTDWAGRSLKRTAHAIADYAESAGKRRAAIGEDSGKQPGDPARAAEALIAAVRSPKPPRHLVLGRTGLEGVERQLASMLDEVRSWEPTSVSADFPERAG